MLQIRLKWISIMLLISFCLQGCRDDDDTNYSRYPSYLCQTIGIISQSIKTKCNIQFWDFMHLYTYTTLESSFYTLSEPCNQSVFSIKYTNSIHDHNEPDYTFLLKMNFIEKEKFFKPGSFVIDELYIYEEKLTGGSGQYYPNIDITFVWDEVSLSGSIYSGKGKIIINKEILHSSFANYKYPAQQIPFEFHFRNRSRK